MSYVRNLILFATFIFIGISASNASADADDFNLDYDDPANGCLLYTSDAADEL